MPFKLMKEYTVCVNEYTHACTYGILFSFKKKKVGNPAIFYMDGAGEHYTKQNKQDTKGNILHDLICTWNLK
jgi:hypothetical protein